MPKTTTTKSTATKKTTTAKKPTTAKKAEAANKIKVLFATAEAFPFAGTGGLGEVAGSLPKALNKCGADVRVIMPLYGTIADKYRRNMTQIFVTRVNVGWRNQYCGVFRLENDGVVTYFIDNEYYFKRDKIYGEFDDGERFSFFSRAVLEVLPALDFKPNVIHCNDHATAMIPTYYATEYKHSFGYEGIKTVFTVHNLEYQGCYPSFILGDVFGIAEHDRGIVDFNGEINSIKGAIETADIVSTVSPTYAREILVPDRSFGLSGILYRNKDKLVGILNGINTEEYDPAKSGAIAKNYDATDMSGKRQCKAALKSECGFMGDKPIVAVISRLAGHKGLDLLKGALERNDRIFDDIDLVVLGTGESYLENFFKWQASRRGNVATFLTYNKDLAQRIYAGADMFLMPSGSEPCGLSQMIACRYGTVPIVRRTGGLADSIIDCAENKTGNGFVFDGYDVDSLCNTIARAVKLYGTPEWSALMKRDMACDFGWEASAREYIKMYDKLRMKN